MKNKKTARSILKHVDDIGVENFSLSVSLVDARQEEEAEEEKETVLSLCNREKLLFT